MHLICIARYCVLPSFKFKCGYNYSTACPILKILIYTEFFCMKYIKFIVTPCPHSLVIFVKKHTIEYHGTVRIWGKSDTN